MRSTVEISLKASQRRKFLCTVGIFMLMASILPLPLRAETQLPLWSADQVKTEVEKFLATYVSQLPTSEYQKVNYRIKQLDARIKLEACTEDHLTVGPHPANQSFTARRMTLKLECDEPSRWRLFVPVSFELTDRVVILQEATKRGSNLTRSALAYRQMDVSMLRQGYFTDIDAAVNQEAKQFLAQGSVLSPNQLKPPRVVHKQQAVAIISRSKSLTVKTMGIALSDGRTGEWIKVQNKSSDRIVEGQVTALGQIEITN